MKSKFHFLTTGLSIFLGLSVIGCTGVYTDRYLSNKREYLITDGKPQAYVDGYMDGCASGMRLAGDTRFKFIKNQIRMDQDALYARGWDDGQICCRNEMLVEQQRVAAEASGSLSFEEERRRRIKDRTQANDAEMRELWDQLRK